MPAMNDTRLATAEYYRRAAEEIRTALRRWHSTELLKDLPPDIIRDWLSLAYRWDRTADLSRQNNQDWSHSVPTKGSRTSCVVEPRTRSDGPLQLYREGGGILNIRLQEIHNE